MCAGTLERVVCVIGVTLPLPDRLQLRLKVPGPRRRPASSAFGVEDHFCAQFETDDEKSEDTWTTSSLVFWAPSGARATAFDGSCPLLTTRTFLRHRPICWSYP